MSIFGDVIADLEVFLGMQHNADGAVFCEEMTLHTYLVITYFDMPHHILYVVSAIVFHH